jgi:hypothetical protein
MLVTTKRMSRPFVVASIRAQAAALLVPGFRLVAGLGEAAHTGFLIERPAGANVVGGFINQPVKHAVAR